MSLGLLPYGYVNNGEDYTRGNTIVVNSGAGGTGGYNIIGGGNTGAVYTPPNINTPVDNTNIPQSIIPVDNSNALLIGGLILAFIIFF